MIHIETLNTKVEMMDHYIFHLGEVVESNVDNLLQCKLTLPNPLMFFPSMLNPVNKEQRLHEINRALNKFVIRLEVHIEALSWYDTLDNVYWGIGNGEPTPKLSWLRYLRWRRYFLHLLLSGIQFSPPNDPPMPEGPPNLTTRDKERMGLTNCFALCKSSGQFASNSRGCHRAADPEDPLSSFPNVKVEDIIVYQFKSMWTIDLNDHNVDSIWMFKGTSINSGSSSADMPRLSRRQQRVQHYLDNRYPEWGRISHIVKTSQRMTIDDDDAGEWSSDAATIANVHDVWQDERPVKQQKIDNDQK